MMVQLLAAFHSLGTAPSGPTHRLLEPLATSLRALLQFGFSFPVRCYIVIFSDWLPRSSFVRTRCRNRGIALVVLCLFAISGRAKADVIGIWNFNNSLTNDIAGGSAIDASNAGVNSTPTYVNTTIGGQAATALDFTAAGAGFYSVANDAASNGGGTGTNNYSFAMDIYVDDVTAGVTSLLQTATFLSDADWYLRPTNPAGMEVAFGGDTVPTTITSGEWNRLVLTRTAGGLFRGYVDGVLVSNASWDAFPAGDVDFRINSEFRPFSDNDGEYNDMQIGALAYWDETLTDAQVVALGGASASGFSATAAVPEPSSLALLGVGGIGFLVCRRRKSRAIPQTSNPC